jgi:hypothetical protein
MRCTIAQNDCEKKKKYKKTKKKETQIEIKKDTRKKS